MQMNFWGGEEPPKAKKPKRKYERSEAAKARKRERQKSEAARAYNREYQRAYYQTEKCQERLKAYTQTDAYKERQREWQKKDRAERPEKHRALQKTLREQNPERYRKYKQAYRERRPDHVKTLQRKHHLAKYRLTLEGYNRLYAEQMGLCANPKCKKLCEKLVVDHDHGTGKIRSLLCPKCNRGLGFFDDNPELLESAAQYLRTHKEEKQSA